MKKDKKTDAKYFDYVCKHYKVTSKKALGIGFTCVSAIALLGGLTTGHFAYKWYNHHCSGGDTPVVADKFVVQFESNGGSVVAAEQVEKGKKAIKPTDPTKDDYKFVDWYLDKSFTTKYDFNSEVKSNLTLYAKWKIPDTTTGIGYVLNSTGDGYLAYCNDYETIPSKVCIPSTHTEGSSTLPVVGMYYPAAQEGDQNAITPNRIGFSYCSNITEIELPETFTKLEQHSFYLCTSLRKINIPSKVTNISDYCFFGCSALEEIVFPEGLNSIGRFSFYDCSSLKNINIPDSVKTLDYCCFYNCLAVENISLGKNLILIPESCFYNNVLLKKVTIPYSVATIEAYAFSYNSFYKRLYNIDYVIKDDVSEWNDTYNPSIPIAPTDLSDKLNDGYKVIKKSYVDSEGEYNIQFIGYENEETKEGLQCAVSKSSSLGTGQINIPSEIDISVSGETKTLTVKRISDKGFIYHGATSYVIPSTVEVIGDNAFEGCTSATSITFFKNISNLKIIGDEAFSNCTALTSFNTSDTGVINIPEGVETIGEGSFAHMPDAINTVNIPSTLHDLTSSATTNPFNLSKITRFNVDPNNPYYMSDEDGYLYTKSTEEGESIPDSLLMLPYTSETTLTIKEGVEKLSYNAFDLFCGNNITNRLTIELPKSLKVINNALDNVKMLESIVVDEDNANYKTVDGVLYNKEMTSLIKFPAAKIIQETYTFEVPDTVTRINNYAFFANSSLITIKLGQNVEYIGDSAFRDCSRIWNINLPASIKYFGLYAFYNCNSLGSVGDSTILVDSTLLLNLYVDYPKFYEEIYTDEYIYINNNITESQIDKNGIFYNYFRVYESAPSIEGYTAYIRHTY